MIKSQPINQLIVVSQALLILLEFFFGVRMIIIVLIQLIAVASSDFQTQSVCS